MKDVCVVKDNYVMTFDTKDGGCYLNLEQNMEFKFKHIIEDKVILMNNLVNFVISKEKFVELFKIKR